MDFVEQASAATGQDYKFQTNIEILDGTYKIRGKDTSVAGMVFPLVDGFKVGATGGYVTVDGRAIAGFPDRNIKIMCDGEHAYENAGKAKTTKREETDEETIDRMRERFDMLEDMTKATKKGDVRAMIVTGPPGVGKSFGVESVLAKHDVFANVAQDEKLKKYEVVKGAMSALGLYSKLYHYKDAKNILVFDDCDSVFDDQESRNIFKAALDTKRVRTVAYKSKILTSTILIK